MLKVSGEKRLWSAIKSGFVYLKKKNTCMCSLNLFHASVPPMSPLWGFCPPPGRLPGNQRWLTFASRVSGLWHIMIYFITWKYTYAYIFSCILLTKILIFFHVLCFYFIDLLVYSSHSMLLITTCSAEPDRGNKLQQASLPPYLQDQFTLLACDWQLRKNTKLIARAHEWNCIAQILYSEIHINIIFL